MVNALRLVVAIVLLGLTHRLLSGVWWPSMVDAQLVALAFSGLVGLTVCDQALLPRLWTSAPTIASDDDRFTARRGRPRIGLPR